MEKTFKSLVLTSYILFLVWWFFPYIDPLLAVDPDQLYLWDSKGFDAKFQFPIWYEYLWLTYWTLAYAGLFFLHRPMRSVFLIGYIVAYIITPFHGTDIQSPWSSIVGDINTLLDGAILAIAFFTSISENFGSNSEKAELYPQRWPAAIGRLPKFARMSTEGPVYVQKLPVERFEV